jgi:hypothetical protein
MRTPLGLDAAGSLAIGVDEGDAEALVAIDSGCAAAVPD